MAFEYLLIEIILAIASLAYLYYQSEFKKRQFKRVGALAVIGLILFLAEIPFHNGKTWTFSQELVSQWTIFSMPFEELLFYVFIFPLVATSLWILAGQVEKWFK